MKERNYGIDSLRLVLMYMVCILHTLGQGGILAASPSKTYWFFEIFAYCAVDGFALISGYMANLLPERPHKYGKIVNMWFQAVFYSFAVTVVLTLIGINKEWHIREMINCLLPITYGKFWYFSAYFALFFAIPVLNKFLYAADENSAKKALIILVFLYTVVSFINDPFRISSGYSAMWLMILYCIGALAKKVQLFEQRKTVTLICIWIISVVSTWLLYTVVEFRSIVNYISPTILLNAIIMVVLFSRIKLKMTFISKISPLAFGIYLFQSNQLIWNNVIKDAFSFVPSKGRVIGVAYVFLFASLIFISGLIVEFIRSKLEKALKIPTLSEKIILLANKIITSSVILLK